MDLQLFKAEIKNVLDRGEIPKLERIQAKFELLYEDEIPEDYFIHANKWWENLVQMDFLKTYFLQNDVHEIIFHNPPDILVDRSGSLQIETLPILDINDWCIFFQVLAIRSKISWNFTQSFASFDGILGNIPYRATLVHSTLCPKGNGKLFIRKLQAKSMDLDQFGASYEQNQLLISIMEAKSNVMIIGPTSAGKTTLLTALLSYIQEKEHVIILEDTHEIHRIGGITTHLIARNNNENQSLDKLCEYALRMRPDRLILGELRAKEIVPFLLNMNTGHKGHMATIHANSPQELFNRLYLLFALYGPSKSLDELRFKKMLDSGPEWIISMRNKKIESVSRFCA